MASRSSNDGDGGTTFVTSFHRKLEEILNRAKLTMARFRARLLSIRGASIQSKVSIGAMCRTDRPWCVTIGQRSMFEDAVYLKVVSDAAVLEFGEFVFVGRGSEFDVKERISIGHHTLVAPGCFVTDHGHGISPDLYIDKQPTQSKPVILGNDVWLGANVTVLPGVTIGDGAVVGSGAVVVNDIPARAVVAGVPARILRYRDEQSPLILQHSSAAL